MASNDDGTVKLPANARQAARQRLDEVRADELRDSSRDIDLAKNHRIGEYVIEELLGRGGFGTVYRAIQPLIGKRVAIKVLSRKFSADPEIVSRFVAEARAVNQIRHRNIIDIFSFSQLEDGRHYYVMEYLDGTPLDRYLTEHGPMSLEIALPILKGIARALDAAHAKGIAHRDLKPENIVLTSDDDGGLFPKLLDFGIAKLSGDDNQSTHKTATGVPIGTPFYMSPEQCRGAEIDHRTDIYSFGVLTFRLLTGTYPFDGPMVDVLHQQIYDAVPAASARNDKLGPQVDVAIGAMMQKDPASRPPSVSAALMMLGGNLAITPLPARTIPDRPSNRTLTATADTQVSGTLSAGAPRRRTTTIVASLLAVLVAGGVLVAFVLVRDHAPVDPTPAPAVPIVQPQPVRPAVAPVTPVAPVAPVATDVLITIAGPPEGTEVKKSGVTMGTAPGKVQLARDHQEVVLTFLADGYLPASQTITPDHDQLITVKLKKKPSSVATHPTGKDDIIHDVPSLKE